MFRHDLRHSGRSDYEGPRAPQVRWRFTPPSPEVLSSYCPPVVAADGTIYIESSTAVNAVTPEGTLKWRFPAGATCQGSPLIAADGTIYVGGAILHALTPEGTERWKFQPMADELGGAPAIASDGTVYVCSEGFGLHALAPDGSLRWTFPVQPDVKTSPAIADDGTIYLAGDDKIFGVSPSGQKRWEAPISSSQHFVPMLAKDLQQRLESYSLWLDMPLVDSQGVAYFATADCTVHAVDRDGNEKWTLAITSVPSCGSPVMDAKGTLYFTSPSGVLIAVGDAP
jgi:outer membrane protein assembly factor BamB